MAVKSITGPFEEAIRFFERKLPLPSHSSRTIQAQEHDHAFIVSGAMKTAYLEEVQALIRRCMADGVTFQSGAQVFQEINQRYGFSPRGGDYARWRVVYDTNIRQAYNAGREAQEQDPDFKRAFPYMQYVHSGAENYRPQHKAWDGLILAADDPWWAVHSPSNGYFCRCRKRPITERDLRKLGRSGPDTPPSDEMTEYLDKRTGELVPIPKGITPGFQYSPGRSWLESLSLKQGQLPEPVPVGPAAIGAMPPPRLAAADQVLEEGLTDAAYVDAFLQAFEVPPGGATVFVDAAGEPILISDRLFTKPNGQLKVRKDGLRHLYLPLLAQTLKDPDEIWTLLEPERSDGGRYRLKRRYIARWELEQDGQPVHGFIAFEWQAGIWEGRTAFTPRNQDGEPFDDEYLQRQRQGVLVYRRRDGE